MAASKARLEALLARVQQRANEPRGPSAAVTPILEAVRGGAARSSAQAPAGEAVAHDPIARDVLSHGAVPQNEVGDEDIEEYEDELIEIIDDADVIPQAAAAARAIEPAAFGAAVERRPSAPIRSEPVAARPASPRLSPGPAPAGLRPEVVAPRPIAADEIARAKSRPRELRHASFVELLDASLKLG